MLIMETIAKVRRLYYVENKGFKTIARELRLSQNTVKNIGSLILCVESAFS
jgi:DNA-binding transcriptional regulator LsrR (DeoR family)